MNLILHKCYNNIIFLIQHVNIEPSNFIRVTDINMCFHNKIPKENSLNLNLKVLNWLNNNEFIKTIDLISKLFLHKLIPDRLAFSNLRCEISNLCVSIFEFYLLSLCQIHNFITHNLLLVLGLLTHVMHLLL